MNEPVTTPAPVMAPVQTVKNPRVKAIAVKIVARKKYIEVLWVKVDGTIYKFDRVFATFSDAMEAVRLEIDRL